jgi:hypothetical protein
MTISKLRNDLQERRAPERQVCRLAAFKPPREERQVRGRGGAVGTSGASWTDCVLSAGRVVHLLSTFTRCAVA